MGVRWLRGGVFCRWLLLFSYASTRTGKDIVVTKWYDKKASAEGPEEEWEAVRVLK